MPTAVAAAAAAARTREHSLGGAEVPLSVEQNLQSDLFFIIALANEDARFCSDYSPFLILSNLLG